MGGAMGVAAILETLGLWTPFLAAGFGVNLLISAISMLAGTVVGFGLGGLRAGDLRSGRFGAGMVTVAFRNIPSFVFMYYIAFMTPVEFAWNGELVPFPAWIKAAVALAIPVIGFVSDQSAVLIRERRANVPNAFAMFAVSWTQYLLIIIMASSTASVIGVDEIVGRANTVIAAVRDPALILWVYAYVALWFLIGGHMVSAAIRWARAKVHDKRRHLRLEE